MPDSHHQGPIHAPTGNPSGGPLAPTGPTRRALPGEYAYVDVVTTDEEVWPLCRLRCTDTASRRGFAIHRASRDGYEDSFLPSGLPAGTPEEALDSSCGLYLGDPTAWTQPPTD